MMYITSISLLLGLLKLTGFGNFTEVGMDPLPYSLQHSSVTQEAVFSQVQNCPIFADLRQGPETWNLKIEGFSEAYFDRTRGAIAVNTIEQPTDKWAAASTVFKKPSGKYTLWFTSLMESDGESSYVVRIDNKQVINFQNPRIHGTDIPEYAPHMVEIKNISIEQGSTIQVEFHPHSNDLVPEGNAYGFARARWNPTIEFIRQ